MRAPHPTLTVSARSEDPPFRYQQLADRLAGELLDGRYGAGARLPSVRRLCELHAASLATVTHALHRLEDAGLIESRPRQGFFARAGVPAAPAPPRRADALDVHRERLMALAATQGDLLSLGHLALPNDLLPLAALRRLAQARLRDPAAAWAEGWIAGSPALRHVLAERLVQRGCRVGADDVVVTQGEAEALQLGLQQLTRAGDRVAVTRPVPLRTLEILRGMGLTLVELPAAETGEEVATALADLLHTGSIAACIASLGLSAAMGTAWPDTARAALVSVCGRHDLPLIECDLLGELALGADDPRPLKAFDDDDRVLHCGSLACVTGTGMSVGWIASGRHRLQMRAARAVHGELLPALTDQVLTDFLGSDAVDRHLRRLRQQLGRRVRSWREAALACLPPGTSVRQGPHGHQLWVKLPAGGSALKLLAVARSKGITFVPGAVFTLGQDFDDCLRLTAGHALEERRSAALRLLGELAHEACHRGQQPRRLTQPSTTRRSR